MHSARLGYLWIAATIALTVYGQVAFKWRVSRSAEFPGELGARVEYVLRLAIDPWIVTVCASVLLASVTWWAALRTFDLSYAYPFMSLTFIGVLLLSAPLLDERITLSKVVGLGLIVAGLIVASR
jgi:multidrug transporter EmrE-like cation transporter